MASGKRSLSSAVPNFMIDYYLILMEENRMANTLIPGVDLLGKGINIYGRFGNNSLLGKIAPIDSSSIKETVHFNKKDFDIPQNVAFNPGSTHDGNAFYFQNRQAFERHYQQEFSLSASYGLLSSEYEYGYSQDEQYQSTHSKALYDFSEIRYTLSLDEFAYNHSFDYLPTELNESTYSQFVDFFENYGTHFVQSATFGGRIFYYVNVNSSYSSNEEDITTKVKAEWSGCFGLKASASESWKILDQEWMDSRNVHISAIGGSQSIVQALLPPNLNENNEDLFNSWVFSLDDQPSLINYNMLPIYSVLDPKTPQYEVVKAAMEKYLQSWVLIQSQQTRSAINILNRDIEPEHKNPSPKPSKTDSSLQVVVVDGQNLSIVYNEQWDFHTEEKQIYMPDNRDVWDNINNALKRFINTNNIIIMASKGLYSHHIPDGDIYNQLISCGAGAKLEKWRSDENTSGMVYPVNYIFVGQFGIGHDNGYELMEYHDTRVDLLSELEVQLFRKKSGYTVRQR
jgi:hypothetical protein